MGVTFRQKEKGKGKPWWVFVYQHGKRKSVRVGSKQAAKALASEVERELKAGRFGIEEPKPVPTFAEYADSWINTTVPATCKESTVRSYQDILNLHVLPVFGSLKVTDITRDTIKDFLMVKMNEGYAKRTVSHMRNVVSGVLNKAIDHEVIPANPAHKLGKNFLKDNGRPKKADPLLRDELRLLLDTAQREFPEHYTLILLLARTGMRVGEALALKWADLDFGGRFINVERGLSRGRLTTPKSGKSRRVDMSLQLKEALLDHQYKLKSEWLFTNTKGGFIDLDNWRRLIFVKLLATAGLRRIRIHDLRHTYASLRVSKGDNIQDVSNQLGHHSVKLTLDEYAKWLPGKKKAEVDALDDQAFTAPDGPPHGPRGHFAGREGSANPLKSYDKAPKRQPKTFKVVVRKYQKPQKESPAEVEVRSLVKSH
jgi:integrase